MKLSEARIPTLFITIALVILFLGLKTTHTDFQDPIRTEMDLSIYGVYVGSDAANPPYPTLGLLAYLGNYKYHLIAITSLFGIFLFVTSFTRRL